MLQAKRIKAFNPTINHVAAPGLITEIGGVDLKRKLEEYRSDMMSGAVDVDQGLEKMGSEIVFEGADLRLLGNFGVCLNDSLHIRTMASSESETCDYESYEYVIQGRVSEIKQDPFKSGDASKTTCVLSLHRYSLHIDNEEIIHIEPMEAIERYFGVDRMSKRRAALGLGY